MKRTVNSTAIQVVYVQQSYPRVGFPLISSDLLHTNEVSYCILMSISAL